MKESTTPATDAAGSLKELQRRALADAFAAAGDGCTVDWLLCDPELQDRFHAACRDAGLIGRAGDWNRELLKLRKSGVLPKAAAAKKIDFSADEADEFSFAAEIAWAELERKFASWSLDALLCSPGKAFLFDRTAAKYLAQKTDAAKLRWAALRLRKSRHSLATEAHDYHYVLKTRDFARYQPWGRMRFERFDGVSGVYVLRNRAKEAVYVGETLDLGRRLATHSTAKAPGRAVVQASVITADELPSADYLAPLWCDLVRRYSPKLNVPAITVDA